jgi:uncharacterized protein (TIGR00730 family)
MELHFTRTNGELDELIDQLLQHSAVHHPEIIREMVLSALKMGQECDYPADLKMVRTSLKEMRYTSKIFAPYRQRKKVTIFGSARTLADEPIYRKCVEFSRLLAERGYMTITGGGGGIMQAGNEGAGAENSFAVNIRLPFEQETNPVMIESLNTITYKYFFTRKLAFVKEADAIALFPGGFGTLDEAMEAMTLIQTGKAPIMPLVMIDDDSGDYWENFFQFVRDTLFRKGLISGEDFSFFSITRDINEAVEIIDSFYRNYHSMRWVGDVLVLRLKQHLDSEQLRTVHSEFSQILRPDGRMWLCGAFPEEQDQPDLLALPRLALEFDRRSYGLLKAMVRRINSF